MEENKSDDNEKYDLSIDENTRWLKRKYYERFRYVPSRTELRLNKSQYINALSNAIKDRKKIIYRRHSKVGNINNSSKV